MKRLSLILSVLFLTINTIYADVYVGANSNGLNNQNSQSNSGKTGVFDCTSSTSQIDLNINNVRAFM